MTESDYQEEQETKTTIPTKPKKQLTPERLEQLAKARQKAIEKRKELAGVKMMEKQIKQKETLKKKKELQQQLQESESEASEEEQLTQPKARVKVPDENREPRRTIRKAPPTAEEPVSEYQIKFNKMFQSIFPS